MDGRGHTVECFNGQSLASLFFCVKFFYFNPDKQLFCIANLKSRYIIMDFLIYLIFGVFLFSGAACCQVDFFLLRRFGSAFSVAVVCGSCLHQSGELSKGDEDLHLLHKNH